MNKILSTFLDRLAERLTALAAGLVSSRVEGLHATAQAEQQSDLEELARRYEAEGKTEIAAALRQRLLRIGSPDLAAEAVNMLQRVGAEPDRLASPTAGSAAQALQGLPDFATTPARPKKKARPAIEGTSPLTDLGSGS